MGLLDVLIGRRRLAAPAPDRLFAMSTAFVTMQARHGATAAGRAAIVFGALPTADFETIVADTEHVVRAVGGESGTEVSTHEDDYGFRWMIVTGEELDGLVASVNAVSTALVDGGYGERVLCAVFAFADHDGRFYWIYNYKRGAFSPFVPGARPRERDTERELVLRARMADELPVEPDTARWFALWDAPI